jgi:hypothetical protein
VLLEGLQGYNLREHSFPSAGGILLEELVLDDLDGNELLGMVKSLCKVHLGGVSLAKPAKKRVLSIEDWLLHRR